MQATQVDLVGPSGLLFRVAPDSTPVGGAPTFPEADLWEVYARLTITLHWPTYGLPISTTEHSTAVSAGPWIELGAERESLLQVLDENSDFG